MPCKGLFPNYVDSNGGRVGESPNGNFTEYRLEILLSKTVNRGEGGQESPKICQRSMWKTPDKRIIILMILTQIQPVESHFQIVNIHNKYLLANLQIVIEFALLTWIYIWLMITSFSLFFIIFLWNFSSFMKTLCCWLE